MITQEQLKELLEYDPNTGIFKWKIWRGGTSGKGKIAGSFNNNKYRQISLLGKVMLQHRLAWLYIYGIYPNDDIDHINGDTSDNRIVNLRQCNQTINQQNRKNANKNNSSGFMGVSRLNARFRARIVINGKECHIGTYNTPHEAHQAYMDYKIKFHHGYIP